MKRILILTAMAALLMVLPSQRASAQYFNHLALGVTAGIDGFGLELAAPIGNQLQLRLGGSMFPPMLRPHHTFRFEETSEHEMADIDLEAVPMFGGANLMLDWHPAGNKWFFITAGMYAGTSKVLTIRNRAPFLDEEDWGHEGIMVGKVFVTTDEKGIAQGTLNVWPVRPYAGIGFGNAINPSKRVCFNFELGAAFTNGYRVKVTGENIETGEVGVVQVSSADLYTGEVDGDRTNKDNYEDKLIIDKMAKFPVVPMVKFGLYIILF
jgi:hypothetical protein